MRRLGAILALAATLLTAPAAAEKCPAQHANIYAVTVVLEDDGRLLWNGTHVDEATFNRYLG